MLMCAMSHGALISGQSTIAGFSGDLGRGLVVGGGVDFTSIPVVVVVVDATDGGGGASDGMMA